MNGQEYIEEMYAFIVIDDDGSESIPAINGPGGLALPLVGANMARVESLKPHAQALANIMKRPVEIVRFSIRSHIESLNPKAGGEQN